MKPEQRVRRRLAPFVGCGEEGQEEGSRLAQLAPPDEPLAGHALGGGGEVVEDARRSLKAVADVVDRDAAETARPAERIQRGAAHVPPATAGVRQCLERQRLGLGDSLDAHGGIVRGYLREHGCPRHRIAAALGQCPLEETPDVVVARDGSAGEQQAGANPLLTRGKRRERGNEQVGQPLLLSRELEVAGQPENALAAIRVVARGEPEGVICELDRGLRCPALVCPSRRGRHVGREGRVGTGCRKRTVPRSELAVADGRCEPAMQLATLCGVRPLDDRRGQQRMGGAHVIAGDDEDAARSGEVERLGVGERVELPDAQVGAQRDGQEQPAHAVGEPVDPQPEEILDRVGHREVLADPGRPVVDQLAPDLEREQGIAERGVVDPPQELARDAQPEPVAQDATDRAEAEWAEFHPLDAVRVERELEWRRGPRPAREEEADLGALEPSRGKREGGGRGGVEPLDVVERDQDGPLVATARSALRQPTPTAWVSGAPPADTARSRATSRA